jgi:hypothetical protein
MMEIPVKRWRKTGNFAPSDKIVYNEASTLLIISKEMAG